MKTALPILVAALLAPLACACGESAVVPPKTAVAPPVAATATTPESLPSSAIRRSDVRDVVHAGVGAFLQRVDLDVDHPVFLAGKFRGFRILALRGDPSMWRGVDLKPGDVVTRVNGFPLDKPEDAQQALDSLEVASELRVEYERDGQTRELRYAIVDDEPAPAAGPAPGPAKR